MASITFKIPNCLQTTKVTNVFYYPIYVYSYNKTAMRKYEHTMNMNGLIEIKKFYFYINTL